MAIPYRDAVSKLNTRRVKSTRPLIPPQILQEDLPLTIQAAQTVLQGRLAVQNILSGDDDRLIVVVGQTLFRAQCRRSHGIRTAAQRVR
ncbi:hypothetical protein AX14_014195 [Amanita brunnescens Koide BX004]|nr:hypothetical protein AX14_014195 [Amanita brunnescens Koide BX004]